MRKRKGQGQKKGRHRKKKRKGMQEINMFRGRNLERGELINPAGNKQTSKQTQTQTQTDTT